MDEQMLEMTGRHNVDVTLFADAEGLAVHVSGRGENDGYIRLTEDQAIEMMFWLAKATKVEIA
jgi:hypothetical protein